jgi:hypothetical protein
VPTGLSLGVIIGTLALAVLLSILRRTRDPGLAA